MIKTLRKYLSKFVVASTSSARIPSPSTPLSNKFYLPQLDGLRFVAFFLVFIHHLPDAGGYFPSGTFTHFIFEKLHTFGWIGVDIFLCLSSFLLTSLLMLEHKKTGSISVKKFFIRRALRIWPLYYLVMLFAFYIFPFFTFLSPALHTAGYGQLLKEHLFPFSIFMGNFSYAYFTNSLTVSIAPLWTVSLEEQFYIFWPLLLLILLPRDRKWFFIALSSLVILSIAIRLYILKNSIPYPTIWTFTLARLDPFALGAFLSYAWLNNRIKPRPFLALCAAIILLKFVICSTPIGSKNTFWQLFAVDLAACLLIYAALYSKKLKMILANRWVAWLGKISFGLYVFHDVMIQVTLGYITPHLNFMKAPLPHWVLDFIAVLVVTILCATISYYGFEKHFLKLKNRYTTIASRPT